MGPRAVIVMPRFTPGVKVERTRGFGAEVVLHGDTLEEARQHAYALAEQQQLSFIHPLDDEAVATAGQITSAVVRERVDDLLLVDEGDIEQAVLMLLEIEKTLVEGAGAASAGDGGGAGVRLGDKKRAATAGPISISDRKLPEKQCESAVAALVIRALWSGTGALTCLWCA